jgi:hypothetical protein
LSVVLATMIQNNCNMPNSSIKSSGLCTSISVVSQNIGSFPSEDIWLSTNTFASWLCVSFSRLMNNRLATAKGLLIKEEGKEFKLLVG